MGTFLHDFHSSSSCWGCRATALSVMDGLPWQVLPLRYGDFIPLSSFLKQQKGTFLSLTNHNLSLLSWCKKKPSMGRGHRVTFNMNASLTRTYTSYMKNKKERDSLTKEGQASRYLEQYYQALDKYFWITPEKRQLITPATTCWEQKENRFRFGDRPLDPKELKYMGYLSPEQCKQIFEVTYHPNRSVQWPSSDWKYNPKIHWVAPNRTQWLCGLNLWPCWLGRTLHTRICFRP